MRYKSWMVWFIASLVFLIAGIMNMYHDKDSLGKVYLILAVAYLFIGISNSRIQSKQAKAKDSSPENLDTVLKELISKGRKIEAIKEYRKATGVELKEAKEYVDLISKKEKNIGQ